MRAADAIAQYIRSLGIRNVFGVCGGGSMYLNDAFRDMFVANHHEQASAFAADAYARISGLGCALVTTGPGGTNAVTGVAASWIDSIPVIFISGQVTRDTLIGASGVRQMGVQESDIVSIVKPITKYAVTVKNEVRLRYECEKAVHIATEGRPGPVWIDIPLDLQAKDVDWERLPAFRPQISSVSRPIPRFDAERPLIVLGNGVHLAKAEETAREFVRYMGMPVVSSWTGADIVPTDDPLYVGRFGMFGDRAANFAVQKADLLLVIGSRLSVPQTGHNAAEFAPGARIVMVDVDAHELAKPRLRAAERIRMDAGRFMRRVMATQPQGHYPEWVAQLRDWKRRYDVIDSEDRSEAPGCQNSFRFVRELSRQLPEGAIVVTDMGTSFTCTFQAAQMKAGQRWITASGHAPMGYALPGAIGAFYASRRHVTCLVGDGALMFNLQELQTIAERGLPIDIFVFANGGYLTMKHTQKAHFGRLTGSEFSFPLEGISKAFGVPLHIVRMDPMQPLTPRLQTTKNEDGTLRPGLLHDMYPHLEPAVLAEEMAA